MGFSIEYLQDYIGDEQYEFIEKLNNGVGSSTPKLVTSILKLLEQSGDMPGYISDSDIKALCIMLERFWKNCAYVTLNLSTIESCLEYARVEKYTMHISGKAPRIATQYEVVNGSTGLEMEYVYPLGEEMYKRLVFLLWSSGGNHGLLHRLGYELEYKDNKVSTPFKDLIYMVAVDLYDMIQWCSVENVAAVEKQLRSLKRKKQLIMCVEYAVDEVRETLETKELIYTADKILPRKSNDPEIRRAVAIIIKYNKYRDTPKPMDLVLIRKAYKKSLNSDSNYATEQEEASRALKEKCDYIEEGRKKHLVKDTHFCFRIIETLKKTGYQKCSIKQNDILDDAFRIVKAEEEKLQSQNEVEKSPIIDIDSTVAITDMLGSGSIGE